MIDPRLAKPVRKEKAPRQYRSSLPVPTRWPNRVNVKRRKRNHARAYGPPGYVEWTQAQQCAACKVEGFSICAHTRTGGTSRKADWVLTIPLCETREEREAFGRPVVVTEGCHEFQHRKGWKALALRSPGFDRDTAVARHQQAWRRHCTFTDGDAA